jgi:hypothetical protein
VILHVWHDDCDWVIAESAKCATVWAMSSGGATHSDPKDWKQWPDEKPLTIHDYYSDRQDFRGRTLTCAEWIAEHGRGFLCSTEY